MDRALWELTRKQNGTDSTAGIEPLRLKDKFATLEVLNSHFLLGVLRHEMLADIAADLTDLLLMRQ